VAQQGREIRKRISSVANTQKITSTMEMVATAKLRRAQGQVVGSGPYFDGLQRLMEELARHEIDLSLFPLFEKREVKRELVLLVTSNRGLCGGFNSNLIAMARKLLAADEAAGREIEFHVAGRKGIQAFNFAGVEMAGKYTDFPDRPTYDDAERVAEMLVDPFLAKEVDAVKIVYAHFESMGRQPPTTLTLLPVGADGMAGGEGDTSSSQVIFEPSEQEILAELLPLYVRNVVFRVLLESVASEQVARRQAMKRASDNAEEMVKTLTLQFNKARQAQITQELTEIMGGVEALK
jgi:F-type H+-transporting ATPase subunit gamma